MRFTSNTCEKALPERIRRRVQKAKPGRLWRRIFCTVIASCFCIYVSAFGGYIKAKALSVSYALPPSSSSQFNVIDISHYDTVDWPNLDGRLGAVYMKATQGTTYTDSSLDSEVQGAESRGFRYGFYHYLIFEQDPAAQARYFYNQISHYGYSCMPALDVEWSSYNPSGCVSYSELRSEIRQFITTFQQLSGQSVMIYCAISMTQYLANGASNDDINFLKSQRLWISAYKNADDLTVAFPDSPSKLFGTVNAGSLNGDKEIDIWDHYDMWQYAQNMSISGSSGQVDADWATEVIFARTVAAKNTVAIGSGTKYYIRSKNSGKYLDVQYGQNTNGTPVQIYDFNGSNSQKWTLTDEGNGLYSLTSAVGSGGKSLDVYGGFSSDRDTVDIYSSNGTYAQKFLLSYNADDNSFTFFTANTGAYKCLDVPFASTASGTQLQQYTYNGTDAQRFYLESVPTSTAGLNGNGVSSVTDGTYYIKNAQSNLFLTIQGNKDTDWTKVAQNTFNGLASQQWTLKADGSGNYTIQSQYSYSGRVLDIPAGSSANGAQLQIYDSNQTAAQKYQLVPNGNGTFSIRTGASNFTKSLDILYGSTSPDTIAQQYSSNGTGAQQFELIPAALNTTAVPDASSISSGSAYYIQSAFSGLFATPQNGTTDSNWVPLIQSLRIGASMQKWVFTKNADSTYTITNSASGKAIDVAAANNSDGATVQLYDSNSTDSQKWLISQNSDGTFNIISKLSGSANRGLNINGNTAGLNAQLNLWSNHSAVNQKWKLIPAN